MVCFAVAWADSFMCIGTDSLSRGRAAFAGPAKLAHSSPKRMGVFGSCGQSASIITLLYL